MPVEITMRVPTRPAGLAGGVMGSGPLLPGCRSVEPMSPASSLVRAGGGTAGGGLRRQTSPCGVQEARSRRFRVHLGRCLHLVWWRRLARLRDVGSLVHRTRVRRGVLVVRRVCSALRGSVRWLHGVVRCRGDVRRGALRTSVDVVGVIGTMRGIVVGSWGATSGTRLACLGALRMGVRPGRPTPCIGGSPAGSTC